MDNIMAAEGTNNSAFADLIGSRVEVWTVGGDDDHCDSGILEAVELPWIRIKTRQGNVFVFSIYHVRLIKLLEKPRTPENMLLRPSMPQQIEGMKER